MDIINEIIQQLELSSEQVTIPFIIINFILCFSVSMVIKYYYSGFSNSLTGKLHIGTSIPLLSSIVFLVIVIIKTSLALSLGLVGALSIVRFRTPIKEPEELIYLFLAIAVGLGFGAGFSLLTSIIVLLILVFDYFFKSNRYRNKKGVTNIEYTLVLDSTAKELKVDELISSLKEHCDIIKFIRIDTQKDSHNIVLLITLKENSSIDNILDLKNDINNISVFQANTNW